MSRTTRPAIFSIVLAAVFVATFSPFSARAEAEARPARINPAKTWGTWDGWGASLCWWAKIFGDRDDIADLLFTTRTVEINGEKLPGLGLNIARYNAGACSWNEVDGRKMAVSKIILPFRQMEGFWLDGKSADPQSKSWDWSVDASQRAMLLKARDRGANWFELFSNSPMWWMCANGNPSGSAKAADDNLAPANYEKFAVYLAAIALRAKNEWGVTFTSVEPFNEPTSKWWFADGKQEGCHFSPKAQAAVLPLLRAELNRRGLRGMPVAASDESLYDEALATWQAFGQATRALVSQVNVHGYQGNGGRRGELYKSVRVRDGKRLWNSEYGGKLPGGLEMARSLHGEFAELHPTAWCYWQPLDGGNKSGWGLIQADLTAKTIGRANPKYFVLAQYARHIRPGMAILDSGDPGTIAAYAPAARKLVLVVFNDGPARDWSCDLSRFGVVKGPVARWITEPDAASRYERRDGGQLSGKALKCALPANSIQTFEVENVAP